MHYKTYRLIVVLLLSVFTGYGQTKQVRHSDQQWLQYYSQLAINDKWTLMVDGGLRWDSFRERNLFIARVGMGYQLEPTLRIAAGLASTGQYEMEQLKQLEIRPYQEIFCTYKYLRLGVQHRFRVEERYFRRVLDGELLSGHRFNFRLRYQLAVSYPLLKFSDRSQLLLNISDEIFINAGHEIVYNVLDKNRLVIGPAFQLNENLTVGLSYMHQYSQLNAPAAYAHDDVAWLTLRHSMQLSKSRKE